ncbi:MULTISPECIES: PqqD family protein [unclassified Nitratiruptor]|uniref:PqqD family protein n=1 Tax=unclassified Nitratiruptor TaxID=2624044 RepID=UPI001914FAB1|nr:MULTISPECIES: PqqD family protein [unclassified Nitratiruptor]BCD59801.1 hypothetical protein NitYY0810_C0558 [Nitratiruptor sp. YY08-10]BCD63725.1 hypothetical protein NitYY0814_C0558 [Nitratiruptor sp. YY08-14]
MLIDEIVFNDKEMGFIPSIGVSFQINETGKKIIEKFKEGKSKKAIAQELSQEYDVPWQEIYIDVEDFLQKTKIYGLIQ